MTSTPTLQEITELLTHSAYNPAIVPQLEAYLVAQATTPETSPYCYTANRTLIKLYQFFPHLADDEKMTLTLILALANRSGMEFASLTCLISEKTQAREPMAGICRYVLLPPKPQTSIKLKKSREYLHRNMLLLKRLI